MNALDAVKVITPYNTEEDCAKFTIADSNGVFKIAGAMLSDREYTFSGWVRAESNCSLLVCQVISRDSETGAGEYSNVRTIEATTEWQYVTHTFTARTTDLDLLFEVGTFYIYHSQLELGNKATDWTPNPEDVDQDIDNAKEFATTEADRAAEDVRKDLITFINKFGEYIEFLGESAISIGSKDSPLVLELDNETGITFKKNGVPIAWWDGNDFYTSNIFVRVEQRARFGDFAYIPRSDGSLSFLKVGG